MCLQPPVVECGRAGSGRGVRKVSKEGNEGVGDQELNHRPSPHPHHVPTPSPNTHVDYKVDEELEEFSAKRRR